MNHMNDMKQLKFTNNQVTKIINTEMNQTIKSKTMGTTMLNLQSKRTLPRDVIKWIQGLDLSYSVKDYRKDMSNGFLIGQIISRYQPGKIPMHAFQNSHNQSRRDNNWSQLQLFFRKYELRRIKIQDSEYNFIQANNDPKSQQLFEFICRLYSICTKRTLPQTPQTLDLPPTQSKNPNLTASYLLKEQGLEKLQSSQISNNSNQQTQKYTEDRVPTRKIGPSPIEPPAKVDVKGIGIKQQINRKMTSKKKSWQMKTQSMYEQTNQYIEKYVFDYLNQILEECLPEQEGQSNQIRVLFTSSSQKPTQVLKKNLNIGKQILLAFFEQVKGGINNILVAMLKELNQIWKFFTYFLRMISAFSDNSQQLNGLLSLISTYASSSQLNQKKKIQKVFFESLISVLISEVTNCTNWIKKQKIMSIIYDFTGRQVQDKKVVLFNLKQKLGSNSPNYILWLSVLVKQEKIANSSEKLVQDFIYYAHQNINSPNSILRLSALKIMSAVSENGWTNLIKDYFMSPESIRKFRAVTQFQQIYYVSTIYFSLIANLLQSHEYLTLIKGKNQGNTNAIKIYNPDHQKQSEQLKQKLQILSITVSKLYFNSHSQTIREVIAKQATNYLCESGPLLLIVINYLTTSPTQKSFEDFCEQQKTYYEFKTSKVLISPPNLENFKQYALEVLNQMIKVHLFNNQNKNNPNLPINSEMDPKTDQQLILLQFCLDNLNIKKLNMELWTSFADNYIQPLTQFLCGNNQISRNLSEAIICKIYSIQFNYDMKIDDLNLYVGQAMIQCCKKQPKIMLQGIKKQFEEQYKKGNSQQVKVATSQINELLTQKGIPQFISFSQNNEN